MASCNIWPICLKKRSDFSHLQHPSESLKHQFDYKECTQGTTILRSKTEGESSGFAPSYTVGQLAQQPDLQSSATVLFAKASSSPWMSHTQSLNTKSREHTAYTQQPRSHHLLVMLFFCQFLHLLLCFFSYSQALLTGNLSSRSSSAVSVLITPAHLSCQWIWAGRFLK